VAKVKHRVNVFPAADDDLAGVFVGIIKAPLSRIREKLGDPLPGRSSRLSDARWYVEAYAPGKRFVGTIENHMNGPLWRPSVTSINEIREWRVYAVTAGFVTAINEILELEVMSSLRSISGDEEDLVADLVSTPNQSSVSIVMPDSVRA